MLNLRNITLATLILLLVAGCAAPAPTTSYQAPVVNAPQAAAPVVSQPVTTVPQPPSGACNTEGEVQATSAWKSVCIANIWVSATAAPDEATIVPVSAPIAPSIPLPVGSPTSFNGATLPTAATSVVNLDGATAFMFGGASLAMPARYTYVAVGTGGGITLAAGITTVATYVGPVLILGLLVWSVGEFVQYAVITTPAYVSHPEAIAVPVAPIAATYGVFSQNHVNSIGALITDVEAQLTNQAYATAVHSESGYTLEISVNKQTGCLDLKIPQLSLLETGCLGEGGNPTPLLEAYNRLVKKLEPFIRGNPALQSFLDKVVYPLGRTLALKTLDWVKVEMTQSYQAVDDAYAALIASYQKLIALYGG